MNPCTHSFRGSRFAAVRFQWRSPKVLAFATAFLACTLLRPAPSRAWAPSGDNSVSAHVHRRSNAAGQWHASGQQDSGSPSNDSDQSAPSAQPPADPPHLQKSCGSIWPGKLPWRRITFHRALLTANSVPIHAPPCVNIRTPFSPAITRSIRMIPRFTMHWAWMYSMLSRNIQFPTAMPNPSVICIITGGPWPPPRACLTAVWPIACVKSFILPGGCFPA